MFKVILGADSTQSNLRRELNRTQKCKGSNMKSSMGRHCTDHDIIVKSAFLNWNLQVF